MPFMPVIVWCARRGWTMVGAATACSLMVAVLVNRWSALDCVFFALLPLFFVGGALAQYEWRFGLLEGTLMQWIGKISYSLYLAHYPLMLAGLAALGKRGVWLSVPVVFPLAWLVWRYVEMPSIALSRLIGHMPETVTLEHCSSKFGQDDHQGLP